MLAYSETSLENFPKLSENTVLQETIIYLSILFKFSYWVPPKQENLDLWKQKIYQLWVKEQKYNYRTLRNFFEWKIKIEKMKQAESTWNYLCLFFGWWKIITFSKPSIQLWFTVVSKQQRKMQVTVQFSWCLV